MISREQLALVEQAIAATGERPARIFRRFRVAGILQRDIAAEMGISLSTVEADLPKVYAAPAAVRRPFDAGRLPHPDRRAAFRPADPHPRPGPRPLGRFPPQIGNE